MSNDALAAARDALARADWQAAYDAAFAASCADPLAAAERDVLLADSLWWLGRLDECIEHREAAFRAFEEAGERRRAGECAVWLYEHNCFKARPAIGGAWLQRARRSLGDDTECLAYGGLMLREAEAAHGRGEIDEAAVSAAQVVELARRLRSHNLEAEALQTLGRLLIDQGRVREGLAHLDEAMLFAIEGRLGPYQTGKIYCSLIAACEQLGDLARAAEWTEATGRWASEHPFAIFPGICRVHRATALTWRGEFADAEREAIRACDELIDRHVPNAGAAFAEVGDIRRRLGDLDGAEAAFARAEELCGGSCAGSALLRLAQGRGDAALATIDSCLTGAGWNRLSRAKLLGAHVQICLAAGDVESARGSVAELAQTAADFDSDVLRAWAASARGRIEVATNDPAAPATLRAALALWQALEVPYEIATTRTLLGFALRDVDPEAAAVSFGAAQELFEQIGARLDASHARDAGGAAPTGPLPAGLTEREVEVLQLIAAGQSNREIAESLFLSSKTVSRHLSNIFTKIGVSSRSAATAFAFENNLTKGRG
ncbi:MAG: hypothetical protein QOI61_1847 [Actinomycetota bacterium]